VLCFLVGVLRRNSWVKLVKKRECLLVINECGVDERKMKWKRTGESTVDIRKLNGDEFFRRGRSEGI